MLREYFEVKFSAMNAIVKKVKERTESGKRGFKYRGAPQLMYM